jgi:hypothetical protein
MLFQADHNRPNTGSFSSFSPQYGTQVMVATTITFVTCLCN